MVKIGDTWSESKRINYRKEPRHRSKKVPENGEDLI